MSKKARNFERCFDCGRKFKKRKTQCENRQDIRVIQFYTNKLCPRCERIIIRAFCATRPSKEVIPNA